jgi:hypothetical protein
VLAGIEFVDRSDGLDESDRRRTTAAPRAVPDRRRRWSNLLIHIQAAVVVLATILAEFVGAAIGLPRSSATPSISRGLIESLPRERGRSSGSRYQRSGPSASK